MNFKKIIINLGLSLILTGCAGVFLAGAAGMIVYDRRSLPAIEHDARIFHIIHTNIVRNPHFSNAHIGVTSYNQVVLLTGQTPDASARVIAERIAQQAPRVTRVYDEITVEPPISFKTQSQDTWITSQARSKMLTKAELGSGSIRIVTENGVVYLMGIVTPAQADLAVNVARQIKGVQKVVKIFQYIR